MRPLALLGFSHATVAFWMLYPAICRSFDVTIDTTSVLFSLTPLHVLPTSWSCQVPPSFAQLMSPSTQQASRFSSTLSSSCAASLSSLSLCFVHFSAPEQVLDCPSWLRVGDFCITTSFLAMRLLASNSIPNVAATLSRSVPPVGATWVSLSTRHVARFTVTITSIVDTSPSSLYLAELGLVF